jgi:hypothetical protein
MQAFKALNVDSDSKISLLVFIPKEKDTGLLSSMFKVFSLFTK